jgi:hypothetical protein
MRRERLVKCRVKNRNLMYVSGAFAGNFNTKKVVRVVERCKGDKLSNGSNDPFINQSRFTKKLAAVHHTMPDAEEFGIVLYDAVICIRLHYELKPLPMIRNLPGCFAGLKRTLFRKSLLSKAAFRTSYLFKKS